jgi:hypothetical protein
MENRKVFEIKRIKFNKKIFECESKLLIQLLI